MQAVTVDEAQTRLVDLVEAAISGETVVITKDGQQIRLVPVLQQSQRPQFVRERCRIWMSDSLDAPIQ